MLGLLKSRGICLDSMIALNDHINRAVKRYSSLFTLPSHKTLIASLFVACLFMSGFAVLPLFPSLQGFLLSLTVGGALFLLAVLSDFTVNLVSLKKDPVFNLRRCSALTLYSNLLWIAFILLGGIGYILFSSFTLWLRLFLLGFCAVLFLRLLVFAAISFANRRKVVFYSVLQPVLYMVPTVFLDEIRGHVFSSSTLLFFASALLVTFIALFCFIYFINRTGTEILGIKAFSVLKIFMANWTENLNEPLEGLLEKLSVERSIKLSLLIFRAKGKIKAAMIVPAFHPGPFKNVGSSALPFMLQKELEKKLKCTVSVAHGLSGHDADLASQAQNQKIIEKVSQIAGVSNFDSAATPFIRGEKNGAHASCQIFGKCALFTLTLAPQTMEDLPPQLESFIIEEAEKRGLSTAIVIDAHNSIEGPFHVEKAILPLKEAAVTSLEAALRSQRDHLQVGAAKVVPTDFSLKEGMGPGGICVIAVKVGKQLTAYVTIDGNNMISGLREKILQRLGEIGFDDGEVLTTDTHVVNGIVLTPRGYYPLGEVMDQEKLVGYIEQAAVNAKNDLEPAEASWLTSVAPNVKVIGEKQVSMLCMLAEKAFLHAKKLAAVIFPFVGLAWATLIILL